MAINWFPGHMATARSEIRSRMSEVDLVIEVLDARIPYSSENPLVPGLRGDKPFIQILNKADLAEPDVTAAWITAKAGPGVRALAQSRFDTTLAARVGALARELVAPSRTRARPMLAMILGIPNVGKSTVINTLSGRTIAKTGNKPGVTTMQQRINAGKDLVLLDTPGFLWPKLSPEVCGYRLAAMGSISDRVLDLVDIAWFVARILTADRPEVLRTWYRLDTLPVGEEALIEAIGRRAGHLKKGGVVDTQKAAERLVFDLRAGQFGPISLERPEEFSFGS